MRPANPVTDIFQMLFRDSDRTLLLALILILSEEKSDPGLLFALLYIALQHVSRKPSRTTGNGCPWFFSYCSSSKDRMAEI